MPAVAEVRKPTSPELRIANVERQEYRRFIPLRGFEGLWDALEELYKPGSSNVSALIEQHNAKTLRKLNLSPMAEEERESRVMEILQDVRGQLKSNVGRLSTNFNYDERIFKVGRGHHYDTIFHVTKDPQKGTYIFGIGAGDQVEEEKLLADQLVTRPALVEIGARVNLKPERDNRFRINFDEVAQRLALLYSKLNPLDIRPLGGEWLLDEMTKEPWQGDSRPFQIGVRDGFELNLELGKLGERFDRSGGNRDKELWRRNGAVLTGSLFEFYDQKGEFLPACLVLKVKNEGSVGHSPVIGLRRDVDMYDLTNEAAAAFGGFTDNIHPRPRK